MRVLGLFVAVASLTVALLGWWIWFNVDQTQQQVAHQLQDYEQEQGWAVVVLDAYRQAGTLLVQGGPEAVLATQFPNLQWRPDPAHPQGGRVRVREPLIAAAKQTLQTRRRMFLWEGGFFVGLLLLGMALIYRTLRREVGLAAQQSNFLSAVTHELKSPLAAIRLYVETMLLRDPPGPKRQRYLNAIRADVERLEGLVGNILAVAQMEANQRRSGDFSWRGWLQRRRQDGSGAGSRAGGGAVGNGMTRGHRPSGGGAGDAAVEALAVSASRQRPMPVDLVATVQSVAHHWHMSGTKARVAWELPSDAVMVAMEPAALHTVARNLVDNAVKYGRPTDASEAPVDPWVQVRVLSDGRKGILEVSDRGVGVAREELDRIFERFYRVGDEMVRQTEGSGLGLYLVRGLVRQHGGEVTAHSEGLGCGATFVVTLPLANGGAATATEPTATEPTTTTDAGAA